MGSGHKYLGEDFWEAHGRSVSKRTDLSFLHCWLFHHSNEPSGPENQTKKIPSLVKKNLPCHKALKALDCKNYKLGLILDLINT